MLPHGRCFYLYLKLKQQNSVNCEVLFAWEVQILIHTWNSLLSLKNIFKAEVFILN